VGEPVAPAGVRASQQSNECLEPKEKVVVVDAVLLAAVAGICLGIALAWTGCALVGVWLGWRLMRQPVW
jgi:hypothetical protein